MSEPVLALPGLGLGPEAWRPTLQRLRGAEAATVRILPGYGERGRRGQDLTPRALAQGVLDGVLDGAPTGVEPDVGRVVLLAHSASCQVAAHVAALKPGRVAALVLVGPTTDPRAASWPPLMARWAATVAHETPLQVPELLRQYARTTLPVMARGMEAARQDSIQETLARATAPVLVVRGRHDHICPADWAATIARLGGAGSRSVTLPAGAHMVPFTHGRLVADVVDAFLGELSGRS